MWPLVSLLVRTRVRHLQLKLSWVLTVAAFLLLPKDLLVNYSTLKNWVWKWRS